MGSDVSTHSAAVSNDESFVQRLKSTVLNELSHQDRLFLILWYAERMTPAEVGAVLNMAPSQAVAMHERLVAQLRERTTTQEV